MALSPIPWTTGAIEGNPYWLKVLNAEGRELCAARPDDARLIAQAPRLLHALRDLMAAEGGEPGDSPAQRLAWAQALEVLEAVTG